MKRFLASLLATALLGAACAPASAEKLISSLSSHQVLVASNFTGTELVLFGSVERDAATIARRGGYDVVVTVLGPRQNVVTRKKERQFGIWTNAETRNFTAAPAYLTVLSNRAIADIAPPELLERLDIGLHNVPLSNETAANLTPVEDRGAFRDALIRLKAERGLYREEANGVTFLTPTLFRASITIPAEAPLGSYDVDVKLFADGANLARTTSALEIVKVGVEQFVANAAREHAFLYGLATTFMALMTGWIASVVFRRD